MSFPRRSKRSQSRHRAFGACSNRSERVFTNARDTALSVLTNGYLTFLSALMSPNFFLNAPTVIILASTDTSTTLTRDQVFFIFLNTTNTTCSLGWQLFMYLKMYFMYFLMYFVAYSVYGYRNRPVNKLRSLSSQNPAGHLAVTSFG